MYIVHLLVSGDLNSGHSTLLGNHFIPYFATRHRIRPKESMVYFIRSILF